MNNNGLVHIHEIENIILILHERNRIQLFMEDKTDVE